MCKILPKFNSAISAPLETHCNRLAPSIPKKRIHQAPPDPLSVSCAATQSLTTNLNSTWPNLSSHAYLNSCSKKNNKPKRIKTQAFAQAKPLKLSEKTKTAVIQKQKYYRCSKNPLKSVFLLKSSLNKIGYWGSILHFIMTIKKISELKPGEQGPIAHIVDLSSNSLHLQELGLLPGVNIEFIRKAPLGEPFIIKLRNTQICLQKEDAERISITL